MTQKIGTEVTCFKKHAIDHGRESKSDNRVSLGVKMMRMWKESNWKEDERHPSLNEVVNQS